ncbi:GCN5-related N-acetyltransferase [Flavobacteriaceae bacterium 3519-10]|nr:GCN5-related N-acetyltransferase [Flavobacteriaceae bacterium 3519-10]
MKFPPYKTFPTLDNERVSLREIRSSDMEALVEISYYDAIKAEDAQQAAEMHAKINEDYFDGNSIHWGIADRATDCIIGTCGYYRGFENGRGELGCVLLPDFRGKGYMSDAMKLAVDFGLNTIGLKQIWAATDRTNIAAVKLLERVGFRKTAEREDGEVEYFLCVINHVEKHI